MDVRRANLSVHQERALLVGVYLRGEVTGQNAPLVELERLADTAGAKVVGRLIQHRDRPDPTYYMGRGKAREAAELAAECEADVIIFDNDLSPAQVRNLEELTGVKVIDRTELILDIFATHARTSQARAQVELAQLEYTLPRLKHMWKHLERIEGGIGTRGPGERQLETDRRLVRKRIRDLRRELAEILARTNRLMRSRHDELTVCLVGYTNAGKTSLLNALTASHEYVADQLFSTLDTRTRIWHVSDGRRVLLSDTVGFIRNLPHKLVASFHATLEETRGADLLLHVVDASSESALEEADAVDVVLAELGCENTPRLLVLNKIDLVKDQSTLPLLRERYEDIVRVSAKTGEGLNALAERVHRFFETRSIAAVVRASPGNGKLWAFLEDKSEVVDRRYGTDITTFRVVMRREYLARVQGMGGEVEIQPTNEHGAKDAGDSGN